VLLSRFRYKIPRGVEADNDNKLGYYEGRTEIYGILFTFTVKKCDLLNLKDFDIKRLYDTKNEWSDIEDGDKNNSVVHNNAHLANPTYLNDFTHINIPTANCVLLSVVSGLSALGFDKQAKQFFFKSSFFITSKYYRIMEFNYINEFNPTKSVYSKPFTTYSSFPLQSCNLQSKQGM